MEKQRHLYPDFCLAGKTINKILAKAGGNLMSPLATVDEAVDSEGTVTQWIKLCKTLVLPDSLETAIENHMGVTNEPLKYQIKWQAALSSPKIERFTWPEDMSSRCLINEELIIGGDITKRSIRRIGFKMAPGTLYVTGDHLSVNPLNSMEMVYRFASCFAAEFMAVADSRGEEMATLEEQINWQLHLPFEVDCIDNGQVYPAPMSFEPTNLAENLQVGVSLSMSESSASDLSSVLKNYLPTSEGSQADETEAVKKFNEISALILAGGKGSKHQDALDSFLSIYPTG